MSARAFSVYVHIPFCLHRCPYCDFNTYAVARVPEKEYLSGLLAELDFRGATPEWRGRPIRTVYFGGGTPSLFSAHAIASILDALRAGFGIEPGAEITLEANPGTVDGDTLAQYQAAGVNRLSMGAQSFRPELLKVLGRIHSAEQIATAVAMARGAGIENVSLDLMYGVPGQTVQAFSQDLEDVLSLSPQHVSAYGLTIEKGTPYYTSYKTGRLDLPSEENVLQMMELLVRRLHQAGIERYEISNFSYPGFEAKHNMVYWNGGDYLGLGAGAHSLAVTYEGSLKQFGRRWSNVPLPSAYIEQTAAHGTGEGWTETVDRKGLMFEFFFLGLRKIAGVSLSTFKDAFGNAAQECYGTLFEELQRDGFVALAEDTVRLSDRGLLFSDSVFAEVGARLST